MAAERILIVDSDVVTAERIARTFAGVGIRSELVQTAAAATAAASHGSYDMVLIAEQLGDSDGLDCFARLRRAALNAPGVLMADRADVQLVNSAMIYGMRHVIAKPVDATELLVLLSELTAETDHAEESSSSQQSAAKPATAAG